MINKDAMRLWVDALRSGDYKQTTEGVLTRVHENGDRSHCCLGVLTEVAIKAGVTIPARVTGEYVTYGKGWFAMPPEEVVQWAGMRALLPDGSYLPALNDSGMPFRAIADLIEEQTLNA